MDRELLKQQPTPGRYVVINEAAEEWEAVTGGVHQISVPGTLLTWAQ